MSATCFNPLLTSAARRTSNSGRFGSVLMFQSTPHPSGKANISSKALVRYEMVVSIHASPQRQGEQIRQVLYKRNILVSIHASPQRQGELRNNIALHLFSECFNPRLTSAARRTPRDAAL